MLVVVVLVIGVIVVVTGVIVIVIVMIVIEVVVVVEVVVDQRHLEVLDLGVDEKLLGRLADLVDPLLGQLAVEDDLEALPLTHGEPLVPELLQRLGDRRALRVGDVLAEHDVDDERPLLHLGSLRGRLYVLGRGLGDRLYELGRRLCHRLGIFGRVERGRRYDLGAGEALVRAGVGLREIRDDLVGKLRGGLTGVGAPPGVVGDPVAELLLVERRHLCARRVRVGGPVAGGVRREHLVGEDERSVGAPAELELRVHEHQPVLTSDALRAYVQAK